MRNKDEKNVIKQGFIKAIRRNDTMARIWFGHFDSIPDDRRELLAEDWARFIRAFLGDGVKNGGTNLAVTPVETKMKVRLDLGVAHIQGYIFECIEDIDGRYFEVDVEGSHPSLSRIDRLVLRLDRTIQTRKIEPVVLIGEASSNPVPPAITRNNNIWEISLAQIRIPAATVNIKSEYITDERLNSAVCGIIDSLITADTEGMFNDFQSAFAERILNLTTGFYHWFDDFRDTNQEEFQEFYDAQRQKAIEVRDWFNTVKTDIALLQTFDVDNLFALPGTTKATTFNADGTIDEAIVKLSGGTVATKHTIFNANGTITVTMTRYNIDGVTVEETRSITTTFNADGTISEVVS